MTNQEAIEVMFNEWKCIDRNDGIHCDRKCESCDLVMDVGIIREAFNMAISALEAQEAKAQLSAEGTTSDLISRQAAIDAILAVTGNSSVRELYEHVQEHGLSDMWSGGVNAAIDIIIAVPSAQPEQQHGRIFQGIVVEYPEYCTYPEYKGKPYFSIKYTENGQGFIGYGTYKPEVLSEYLKKYFMPPAQPSPCEFCKHNNIADDKACLMCSAERRTDEGD